MAGNPLTDPNWAAEVTKTIVSTIDKIRDRTTTPVVMLARAVVFGLLGGILSGAALVLIVIALTRGLINLLEWPLDHDTAVWVSYAFLGSLFVLIGSICMTRRQASDESNDKGGR